MLRTCVSLLRRRVVVSLTSSASSSWQPCISGSLNDQGVAVLETTRRRQFSSGSNVGAAAAEQEKIVAAVVLERLPVVLPQLAPPVEAFQNFSFEWQQQYRREYPKEFLDASSSRGDDEGEVAFEPAPTVTEADRTNNRRSLDRALCKRLYLILQGFPHGGPKDKPIWHFPEKEYSSEDSLRKVAESAVELFAANPSDFFFVGNAPCGHLAYRLSTPPYKRFFFKSQMMGSKVNVKGQKIRDYAWVAKDELAEYFDPAEFEYMKKMLID
jgi:large subunit ribosomal protein L46